jgi:TolA-binding protein/cytochrome c-type biogenesis protein CcmH/NrfG
MASDPHAERNHRAKGFAARALPGVLAAVCLWLPSLQAHASSETRDKIKIRKKTRLQSTSVNEASSEYNAERAEILAQKRRALILDIQKFIRDAHDSDQKAELNLRLSSLYMEDYNANLAKAQQLYDTQMEAYRKDKRGKRQPKLDNSEAMAALDRARAIYKDLIKRYPRHPRRDEMLYFVALASLDRGKTSEGMAYFKQLSDELPNSKYCNDALVQLGDYYFDANQFAQAEVSYAKLVARKYRPLLAYAVYKKAWCDYNQQRQQQALQQFKWVIQNEDSESGAPIRVRNEALRDITLPFVDLKLVNDSIAFFKAFGDPFYRTGIETMASLYFEQGDYHDAVALYQLLLGMDPNYQKNPTYEINIVEALKLQDQTMLAVNRLFNSLPNYLEHSNWYEINSSNAKVIQAASDLFEETARKYALQLHAEGQKTKNEKLYTVARQLYSKYLEYFPNKTNSMKVRFYLAEILYKQRFYAAAADQYYAVYRDPGAGPLRLEAIRSALSALDLQLNGDRAKAGLSAINSKSTSKLKEAENATLEVTPYSPSEQKFVDIAAEYLEKFAANKDCPDVLYEQAYLLYSHHDLVKAYKAFWVLVQKYPRHPTAIGSAYLILDVLNRRKEYPKLITACHKMLDTREMSNAKFRTDVADILRKAELKRIQIAEEQGNFKEAADNYVEYTQEYGAQDTSLFEKALYNAAVDYGKAQLIVRAAETQEKFLRMFPKSNLRENMLLQVAKTYESLANFDKAAVYFEYLARDYPRNPQAKIALRLAGLYYWGSGNTRHAEGVMLQFAHQFPAETKTIEHDLVDLYEREGAVDREIAFLLMARSVRGIPLSTYLVYSVKVAELQAQRSGRIQPKLLEEALKVAQKHGKEIAQTPKGVEALAKLNFWLTSQQEQAFYGVKLNVAESQLERNLKRKLELLKVLERDYGHIVALGNPDWGLAAIYKTAAAYRSMAQAVLAAPVPSELSGEQLEQYRSEIQKQMIKPFNEKAKNFAESCLDKAQEFDVLSSWRPKCYGLAAELEPDHYPMVRTFYLPSVRTALLLPGKDSKTETGNVKRFAYPFYASALFDTDRAPASVAPPDLVSLYDASHSTGDASGLTPLPFNYRTLAEERRNILKTAYDSEKPEDVRKGTSFAFLNLAQVLGPQRSVPLLMTAIQKDPTNPALNNLLGLAYLGAGNYPAAEVTWLSLVARGVKSAAIWNNLGVLSILENNERQAMDYFQEAVSQDAPREALINLASIALKYRNGFQAKKYLEKALAIDDDDVMARGLFVTAQLQNRELDAAKDGFLELTKKYKTDPYSRLALGYFLIDVEKDSETARKELSDYVDQNSLENDLQFRQALQEARRSAAASQAAAADPAGVDNPQGSDSGNSGANAPASNSSLPSVE